MVGSTLLIGCEDVQRVQFLEWNLDRKKEGKTPYYLWAPMTIDRRCNQYLCAMLKQFFNSR